MSDIQISLKDRLKAYYRATRKGLETAEAKRQAQAALLATITELMRDSFQPLATALRELAVEGAETDAGAEGAPRLVVRAVGEKEDKPTNRLVVELTHGGDELAQLVMQVVADAQPGRHQIRIISRQTREGTMALLYSNQRLYWVYDEQTGKLGFGDAGGDTAPAAMMEELLLSLAKIGATLYPS